LLIETCCAGARRKTHAHADLPRGRAWFGDTQVLARKGRAPQQILDEYTSAHERTVALAKELGADRLREVGTIPWYGPKYSIDDFIVYANYAHKREHLGQLKQFRLRTRAA
jgi:hypothetical protein